FLCAFAPPLIALILPGSCLHFPLSICPPAVRVFSVYRSADHHHLLSFPTRRSSDLAIPSRPRSPASWPPACSRSSTWSRPTSPRSEEHTSELQSRFDLVCRLLLEKKNIRLILAALSRNCRPADRLPDVLDCSAVATP